MKSQAGFTLVELMIAMALGLIISAAAIMLFITAQRSYSFQQGLASLQDDANFGLNYIVKDIRSANLNNTSAVTNEQTLYGGLVFTSAANADTTPAADPDDDAIPLSNLARSILPANASIQLLSRSHGDEVGAANGWTGISNVIDIKSDQLVVQYMPQYFLDDNGTPTDDTDDKWFGGVDCEGQRLEFTLAQGRHMVVQRYFLRLDNNSQANEPNSPLALACDAGRYPVVGDPTLITDYGDAGQIILKRVDHFRVLYGVQGGDTYQYMSSNAYMALSAPRPRILSIQLGVLARSSQSIGNDSLFLDGQAYPVLDQNVIVATPEQGVPKFARQVITQTVALRNTFGGRGL